MENVDVKKADLENKCNNTRMGQKQKVIVCVVIIIIASLIIASNVLPKVLNPNAGSVTTFSQSSLEKIVEINDLATLDYTYNAIAAVYEENDNNELKYHVAYEGTVTAGIDITKVGVKIDKDNKEIVITIPEAVIQDVGVNMGTLEFIFENEEFETETVSQEAYKAGLADLEKRAKEDDDLLLMAKENAIMALKALLSPWIEQIDGEYDVEVK